MGNEIIQPSFAGGELAPELFGRTDIARYGSSLKALYNMIVRPYGGVENRAGLRFVVEVKNSANKFRMLPFEFSEDIAYVIELGDFYARFIYQGAQVLQVSTNAYAGGTTYSNGQFVLYGGITYKSLAGANTGHQPDISPTWWFPNPPHEIVTPWAVADLPGLDYTQSADVLYVTHQSYPQQVIKRLTANSFVIRPYVSKNGPFADINGDESWKVASSAATGNVTLTASKDTWTADDVGSLFYLEQKDLAGINPWEPGDRGTGGTGMAVGDLRRSDGKTYRCSKIAPHAGTADAFTETGSNTPVHDHGKAWDGPGDKRNTGTTDYAVGVQWEYLHSGYGFVLITGFTNTKTVTGVVAKRLPDTVVGGISGGAGGPWAMVGDGVTLTFPIAGAVSASNGDYAVTIDGVGVQPDPFYQPPDGAGNGGSEGPGGGKDPL